MINAANGGRRYCKVNAANGDRRHCIINVANGGRRYCNMNVANEGRRYCNMNVANEGRRYCIINVANEGRRYCITGNCGRTQPANRAVTPWAQGPTTRAPTGHPRSLEGPQHSARRYPASPGYHRGWFGPRILLGWLADCRLVSMCIDQLDLKILIE